MVPFTASLNLVKLGLQQYLKVASMGKVKYGHVPLTEL